MNKTKGKRHTVVPTILVLEGLYADTRDIIEDAGGYGIEASPWDFHSVSTRLKSGRVDGIILTGGSDVNPARYGQLPHSTTQSPDNARDFTELATLRWARENKVPVLGICRGSQIMCVSQGGTLVQDIPSFCEPVLTHGYGDHLVYCDDVAQTLPRACAGNRMEVVSLHHQCVDQPGRGMRIAARSFDGIPEAIESKDGLMLGVQFHPEMAAYNNEQAWSIFRWLVETAAFQKGGKAPAATFHGAVERYKANIAQTYQEWKEQRDWDWFECSDGVWRFGKNAESAEADAKAYQEWKDAREGTPYRQGKHRQAGDPAIPSMREEPLSQREMVNIIENATGQAVTVTDAHGNVIEPDGSITGEILSGTEALEQRLKLCPTCGLRFDCIEDCDDHKKYIHPQRQLEAGPPIDPNNNDHNYSCDLALRNAIEERFASRYPGELATEPPPGDAAWEDADDETIDRWLRQRIAVENGFDPEDWEDIDA